MRNKRIFVKILFGVYSLTMLWLLFVRARGTTLVDYLPQLLERINLIPFVPTFRMLQNLWNYPEKAVLDLVVYNIGGNIGVFLPMGFLLPLAWERYRKFGNTIKDVAVTMTVVEGLQALTLLGFCETDDVLLNLLGTAIGYGLWKLMFRKAKK